MKYFQKADAVGETVKYDEIEYKIRKVLGSSWTQLIFQLISEVLLVTLLSVLLSLSGARILLSFLNPFLDLSLTLQLGTDGMLWIFLGAVTVAVTLFSGRVIMKSILYWREVIYTIINWITFLFVANDVNCSVK